MADPNIRSYYDGNTSRTEVDSGMPVIQPLTARDQLMALIDQESRMPPGEMTAGRMSYMPRSKPRSYGGLGKNTQRQTQSRGPMSEVNRGGPIDVPWYSQQGAAMRPVGLGAQMIPGMGVDPRMLPPSLRPGAASFQNLAGESGAGLDSAPAPVRPPSSNAGFDYLPASEQARWLAAMGRQR